MGETMTMTVPSWLDGLAKKLAPDIRLHPKESYLPCSPEWLLPKVTMYFARDEGPPIVCVAKPLLTAESLVNQTYDGQHSWDASPTGDPDPVTNFYLTIPSSNDRAGNLESARLYYHFRELPNGEYDIVYCVFYAYNGPLTYSSGLWGGAHEGDWEHVTVRIGLDQKIVAVDRAAHGNEGRWYTQQALKPNVPEAGKYCLGTSGQVIVYSAKDSHASYPAPGTQVRAWSLPDDVTADGGKVLVGRDRLTFLDDASAPLWLKYTGRWGAFGIIANGPATPTHQKWWKDEAMSGPVSNAFKVGERKQDWVSTPNHPALAADGDTLYIAIRTDEHTTLIWHSSDLNNWTADGKCYPLVDKQKIATDNAPALTIFQKKLYLAVNRSDQIRFYSSANPASTTPTWKQHWSLTDRSFAWEPSFAVWDDTLYLGVTPKNDTSLVHIYEVNETAATLVTTVKLPVKLSCAASLVVHKDTMFVFFRANDDALGMMRSTDFEKWSVLHVLPGTTVSAPGAAVFRDSAVRRCAHRERRARCVHLARR